MFKPLDRLQIGILSKFVGKQYLNNIEDERGTLPNYFINDFNAIYSFPINKIAKEVILTLNVNNIFDRKYASNAADYGSGFVYYYPQAGSNFMLGATLKF
jgi:iron complex outermembrane receptor protein